LELLEPLKVAGVNDRVRMAAQGMYQALTDAEAQGVIGADAVNDSWGFRSANPRVTQRIVLSKLA